MKKIIYNNDNISLNEVNNLVKRAKIIFINSNSEILLVHSNNNYFLPGGHVEGDESDIECLKREIKEEIGVDLDLPFLEPFLTIEYFNKDYPSDKVNTLSLINYYYLKKDILPNLDNISLTNEEKEGNFKLEFININDVLDFLTNSLDIATRKGVVLDTMEAIKEFKNII